MKHTHWLTGLLVTAALAAGTLAAAYFFKDLAGKGQTKYIELNGEGSIDSIKETLLSKLD